VAQETELASQIKSLHVELSRANELVNSLQKKGGEVLPVAAIPAEVTALLRGDGRRGVRRGRVGWGGVGKTVERRG